MSEIDLEIAAKFDKLAKECCERVAEKMGVVKGALVPVAELERVLCVVGESIAAQLDTIPGHIREVCAGLSETEGAYIEQQIVIASKFAAAAAIHRILKDARQQALITAPI